MRNVDTLIRPLFRAAAVTVEAVPRDVDELLWSEEREYIRGAAPERRAEFGTARLCARQALAVLGEPPLALVPGDDGAPVWPPGIVGSISHTRDYCAVVLDRNPPLRAVGLDVEIVRPLERALLDVILTPRERSVVLARPPADRDALSMLIFSAKEASYKCQFPLTRTQLDFHELEIEIRASAGRFTAHLLRSGLLPRLARLEGSFLFEQGRVMCGVELIA